MRLSSHFHPKTRTNTGGWQIHRMPLTHLPNVASTTSQTPKPHPEPLRTTRMQRVKPGQPKFDELVVFGLGKSG
jgi:hypothetical protein